MACLHSVREEGGVASGLSGCALLRLPTVPASQALEHHLRAMPICRLVTSEERHAHPRMGESSATCIRESMDCKGAWASGSVPSVTLPMLSSEHPVSTQKSGQRDLVHDNRNIHALLAGSGTGLHVLMPVLDCHRPADLLSKIQRSRMRAVGLPPAVPAQTGRGKHAEAHPPS
jgi:hypothetical protein